MRPGDAPSHELDAIEAEELEDSASEDDANEIELLEAAPADTAASGSDTEHLSDAPIDHAPLLEGDAPTLRTLGRLRRSLIMTMRAESKVVTQLSNADGRAAKQESVALEAGSLVLEVAPAARAAAAQAEDAYSTARGARPDQAAADGACASVLAARAADRFRELAEAELNAAAARKRAVDARERATAIREDAIAKIRDTHRQLVRAAGVYNAFLLQVGRTRAGHRETGSAVARDAGQDADGDSDEPHGVADTALLEPASILADQEASRYGRTRHRCNSVRDEGATARRPS